VVEKPQGVIDDWEFFWGLAARMNLPLTLKYWNYGLDFDAIEGGLPLDMVNRPDPEELFRYLCRNSTVPFDTLLATPGGVRPDMPPQYVLPAPADNGARLELCPADVAEELKAVLEEESDRRFGYQLTCRRILEAINCAYRDAARTRNKYPVNWAYMNPQDMTDEGLSDGDQILIESEAGQIQGMVKAESRLRRGVISMTHMFGELAPSTDPVAQGGSFTGRLTSLQEYLEPINFMPRFSGIPVNVTPTART
jgi:anaerobic selenocysteine-containing dehydrogenase